MSGRYTVEMAAEMLREVDPGDFRLVYVGAIWLIDAVAKRSSSPCEDRLADVIAVVDAVALLRDESRGGAQ